ncbi:uncharacterized protein L201_003942 [Kwoniella dendrophila CBS 6074]|uniref:Initiator tRNA phosphoribosyl transferase n=1 Tax=Kwoniella dendrophila CBS 6074 TaxID=1295534 RepID=A0AAX4JUJ1_9TREE
MSDIRAVRKYAAQHDLFNRIHSISADEKFVRDVAENWFDGRFEVVPNQRCGNWYCDPSTSSKAYAYFKSTDGHMTQWDFNLRRSNLNLAKYAEDHGGLILVDSTRRGKRMPDGLSKTVPIWCCVINLALELRRDLSIDDEWDTELYLPPKVVSPSEKSQIEERLDVWAETLEKSSLPLPNLTKPLRPFFIHPSTSTPPSIPLNPPYTPIICLSASRWVNNPNDSDQIPSVTKLGDSNRTVGFDYVPGGGDDDELWARGLTPTLFHANKNDLLKAERDDLPSLVDELVLSTSLSKLSTNSTAISSSSATKIASNMASSNKGGNMNVTGIPNSQSRIGLDIGLPIIQSEDKWIYEDSQYITIRLEEYEKYPRDLPRILRILNQEWVLAVANSKTEGKAYEASLRELVNFVMKDHKEESFLLVHGSKNDIDKAIQKYDSSPSTVKTNKDNEKNDDGNKEIILEELPSPSVEGRKLILPIILALICSDISENEEEININKDYIAIKLHSLISLWPDGNPPRSSLKRVNEFLMSGIRK